MLTVNELIRYQHHLRLKGFGKDAQLNLKNSKVLLIGAGGLGCPSGLYLAAAGVGTIGVADNDIIELSNLQRQIAHSTEKIGEPKAKTLIQRMYEINPLLNYNEHFVRITSENVSEIISNYDLIIDGTDNFFTRFLLADACFENKRPLLSGAVFQYEAQIFLHIPDETPCYRCIFDSPPETNLLSCNETGVLGVIPGVTGLLMTTEAIKFLSKIDKGIRGKLLIYDAFEQSIKRLKIEKKPACKICGNTSIK